MNINIFLMMNEKNNIKYYLFFNKYRDNKYNSKLINILLPIKEKIIFILLILTLYKFNNIFIYFDSLLF